MSIIAHLDMDAFFAAVEERENPQFAGLGIVVGADPKNGLGRGVVSTANYQARKYGIHSAMPISTAWRLSQIALQKGEPKTVFLPVNGSFYSKVSDRIFGIVRKYVPVVEQNSIDEAYLDLPFLIAGPVTRVSQALASIASRNDSLLLHNRYSRSQGEARLGSPSLVPPAYDKAVDLIEKIKAEIKSREKLTAKVGIGPNKLIAKMASAACRPDGMIVIRPDEVANFLDPLPIGDIPGLGPKSEEFFHKKKIFTVSQLRQISREQLTSWVGKHGEDIYQKVRGIDDSPITVEHDIKSISEQETFETDTLSAAFILDELNKLSTRVVGRMRSDGIKQFKTVTIVVRFSDFTTKNRAHSLKDATADLTVLRRESMKLLLPFLDRRENPNLKKIRLIGVGIENFGEEKEEKTEKKKEHIAQQSSLL